MESPFIVNWYIGKTYHFYKIISFLKYIFKWYSRKYVKTISTLQNTGQRYRGESIGMPVRPGGENMSALTVSKEEEKRLKGQGFLNNRGTDEFSARVITVNGKVTAAQHRCMAEAAEKFGNGNLTYTTRLSVEIQGIPYEKIEEFQEFIAKEGLETGGTGSKGPTGSILQGNHLSVWTSGSPMQFQKRFSRDSIKATVRLHCRINLRSQ